MKQLLVLSALAFFFGSCEKCSECHYDKAGAEIEIGEFCDDDLEAIENSGFFEAATDSTYEVHCHDH